MSQTTPVADALGIGEGFRVWVVGESVEETAFLEPAPEGVETFDAPVEELDAALIVTDDPGTLDETLDDVLPRLGSVPVVWVCFPPQDVEATHVRDVVEDYGWLSGEPVTLDDTWSAVRLGLG